MEIKDKDNKRTIISILATILFHVAFVLLLMFMGFKYPDPPPAERGVEMDIGSLLDAGNAMPGELGGSDESNPIHDVSDVDENTVNQNSEEAPISSKKVDNKQVNTKKVTDKPKVTEEKINPNALFQKGKVKASGSGEGTGSGDGKGDKDGGGGGTGSDMSGSGTSFSLAGRGKKSIGLPSSKTNEVGSIIVTIFVDQDGNVVRAVAGARGTTIDNKSMWRHCEYAARQSKFSSNPNAPEEQRGTITYKFRR